MTHILKSVFLLLAISSQLLLAQDKSPNIVLVITDDQGYGDMSCLGNPILKTPAIDALYEESIHLTDYHVSPTCAPTRGALFSGHYTNRAGPWHTIKGRSFLRTTSITLAEEFQKNGYTTGMFGKWHLGDNYPFRAVDRGFDESVCHGGGGVGQTPDHWDNSYFDDTYSYNGHPKKYKGYCTDVFFNEAKRFISEQTAQGKPFFAYISPNAPHSPFHCPEKYWKPYMNTGISKKEAIFFGMIANIDENVGNLRSWLKKKGLYENTIFIFTTDNGSATGVDIYNAGMRGKKGTEYDGGHRVPFFMHWPEAGLTKARDIHELTAHIDILPTLLDLCGMEYPNHYHFDGKSIAPLIFENPISWPDRTIITDSQRVTDPIKWKQSAVMTSDWRLVNGTELYAIKNDPGQKEDVANAHPQIVERLRNDYDAWWADISPTFAEETRIVIGNDSENPMQLTGHDWVTNDHLTPWHQSYIRNAKKGLGKWQLQVAQNGRYRIALRRWPLAVKKALTDGLESGKPVPGLTAFREAKGVALPIRSAILKIGDFVKEKAVKPGGESIVFEVDLDAGKTELDATFLLENGDTESIGVFYAVVERI